MALKKQPVKLHFTQGTDTKGDEFLTTKLLRADNVLFDGANTLKTRHPFTALDSEDAPSFARLSEYRGSVCTEDTANAGGAGYFCQRDAQTGAPTGMVPSLGGADYTSAVGAEDFNFIRYMQDVQTVGSLGASSPLFITSASSITGKSSAYAWMNTIAFSVTGAIAGVLIDDESGGVEGTFRLDPPAGTTYDSPSLLRIDGGTNLYFLYYRRTVGGVSSLCVRTSAAVAFDGATERVIQTVTGLFDVSFHTTAAKVYAVCATAGNNTTHLLLNLDGYTVSSTSTTAVTAAAPILNMKALSTYDGTTVRHFAFFTVYGTSLWMVQVNAAGVAGADGQLFNYAATWAAGEVVTVTACDPGNTADVKGAVEVRTASTATANPNNTVVFTWNMPKATAVAVKRGTIIGQPLLGDIMYDSSAARVLLPLRRYDLSTPSVHIVDVTRGTSSATTYDNVPPVVVSRPEYGNCGGLHYAFAVPPLRGSILYDGRISVPITRWVGKTDTDGTTNVSPWHVVRALLTPPATSRGQLGSIETQGCLLLAAGCPQWYDGRDIAEAGFNYRPWISCTPVAGGGSLGAGEYSVACTYMWEDSQGNWHESAPSDIVTADTTAVGANGHITVTVGLLGLTRKRRVRIRLYRSGVASGSLGGRLLYEQDVLNDLSVATTATTTMTISAADSVLTGSSTLETTGGNLPNAPPPACRHIEEFSGRLWFSGCSDGFDLAFSQPLSRGFAPECAQDFGRRAPGSFGRIVATSEMENRLAVFCENQLGVLYGSGPTPAGEQDNYSELAGGQDVGTQWQSPLSVVSTRDGVWFHSEAGLRLVQNDGQLATTQEGRELGSEIDDTIAEDATIVAGVRRAAQEVWFADLSDTFDAGVVIGGSTASGHPTTDINLPIHVWNWTWRQWTRLGILVVQAGNPRLNDMVVTSDLGPTVIMGLNGQDGVISIAHYDETLGTDTDFGDDAGDYDNYSVLATAPLSFAGILGFQRAYRLQLLFQGTPAATCTFEVFPVFDGASPATAVASISVTIGADGAARVEHLLQIQKCQSLQLYLVLRGQTAGIRLTSMTLLVGVKGGVAKLPTSQRF